MNRSQLIEKYQNLLYKFGEYDVWDDDIEPKLSKMTTEEIKRNYNDDKKYYTARKNAGGCW